jgi:hypothetical protein
MNWDGEKIWINGWFSCTNTWKSFEIQERRILLMNPLMFTWCLTPREESINRPKSRQFDF